MNHGMANHFKQPTTEVIIFLIHILINISRHGIEIAGISSDGDPKLLSAMVYENSLLNGINVTQDIVHVCTKSRNRLIKRDINLPMGMYKASSDHLKKLVKDVQKSVHGLTFSDVFPTDRMNYDSFGKIVQDRVIDALRENIPGSDGTIRYLLTFRDIFDSFSSFNLKPLDRLFRIYRSLFFLRIWREFIKNSRSYTLGDNFITYNTYMCVEINAKNLLHIMRVFRDRDAHDLFLPSLFDSQTCERIFRTFRSMGTTNFTRINFCLLELIHMIGRVEAQTEIAYCKLDINGIKIPHKRNGKTKCYNLPMDEEIDDTISKAKQEAIQNAELLGIVFDRYDQIDEYRFISKLKPNGNINEIDYEEGYTDDDMDENITDDNLESSADQGNDSIENESIDVDASGDLDVNSRLVKIVDEKGVQRIALKSSLVWMLTEPGIKMSNDRLKRFKSKSVSKKRKISDT